MIATIFLPLSFITGFFGQNFGWMVGEVSSWQAFVLLGIGLELLTVVGAPRSLPPAGMVLKQLWAPWRLEYIQGADQQEGCVFCRAADAHDEAALVVHRGEHAFVLLNRYPYASGHLMVAPYRHEGTFAALKSEEALEIHQLSATAIGGPRSGHGAAGLQPRVEPRAASQERESWTTCTSTSFRAGAGTRTSCLSSAT